MSTVSETKAKTLPDLSGFTGSETIYRHGLNRRFFHTEGIQHLADAVGAHWLIDVVASHQPKPKVHGEPFQLWRITLKDGGGCTVTMRRDSGERPIIIQRIPYTDFPEDFEWYACENGQGHTMMLKSEY